MKKLALLCSWTTLLSAGALDSVWTNVSKGLIGSVPGVSQLVIDRATGSTFYALTSGGVFKSTVSGSSWTAVGNIGGVDILALDPASSVVYAGTSAGLFKSTDAGESWAFVGLSGTSIVALAIDPITPSTLYAGSNGHLYKSTDRGTNWTDLNLAPPGADGLWIAGLVLDPSTPSTLYLALGQGAGGNIIKSVDGGATWNLIYANAGPFYNTLSNLVIDPSNPSTLYRINPMKKSTDGGVSWSQTGFTNSVSALTVDPRNSNTLYVSSAGNAGHAIYKSTDGGQNWDVVDTIIPPTGSFVFSPGSSTIYAATGSGVFKSTDGGLNWGEAKTGMSVLSIRTLAGDPVNTATIYSGGDDGLFKSIDSAGDWEKQAAFLLPAGGPFAPGPAEVHSLLVDFTNAKTLYLGIARPGGCYSGDVLLFKGTDGGATWNNGMGTYSVGIGCDGVIDAMAMDPIDPNTLYLPFGDDCCFDFTILKTTDGGAHWENPDTRGAGGG